MCSTVVLQMNVDLHKTLIFILIQVKSDNGWDMGKNQCLKRIYLLLCVFSSIYSKIIDVMIIHVTSTVTWS